MTVFDMSLLYAVGVPHQALPFLQLGALVTPSPSSEEEEKFNLVAREVRVEIRRRKWRMEEEEKVEGADGL